MTRSHLEATKGNRGPARWRYLIDIIVLVALTFLLDAVLGAFVQVPIDLEKGLIVDAIVKVLLIGVGCGLVLLRGERLADIGLKRPECWKRTLIIGVGLAAMVFVTVYLSEKAGFRRDLSKFRDVQGNPQLASVAVLYALIGAGFMRSSPSVDFSCRAWRCCLVAVAAHGLALVFCKARCSEQHTVTRIRWASLSPAHSAF